VTKQAPREPAQSGPGEEGIKRPQVCGHAPSGMGSPALPTAG